MAARRDTLRCYFPGKRFPAYSVTESKCALGCSHCEGRLLHGMRGVPTAEALIAETALLAGRGGTGFLLSGGCDEQGRVPLLPFVEAVSAARKRWGLLANLHPGLLDEEGAVALARSEADCYSFDVHQSERVLREVLHLDVPRSAYGQTLEALESAGSGSIVPHVTVGLDDGEDALRSVALAAEFDITGLVVLVFTPIRGTSMASRPAPSDGLVLEVIEAAKGALDCPIILGCVRPRGNAGLEMLAVQAGIRDLAMPSRRTMDWAEGEGLRTERVERCCALHL